MENFNEWISQIAGKEWWFLGASESYPSCHFKCIFSFSKTRMWVYIISVLGCVCGDWRRTSGASLNHVSPLFLCVCFGFWCVEIESLPKSGACWWAGVANELAPVGCRILSLQSCDHRCTLLCLDFHTRTKQESPSSMLVWQVLYLLSSLPGRHLVLYKLYKIIG